MAKHLRLAQNYLDAGKHAEARVPLRKALQFYDRSCANPDADARMYRTLWMCGENARNLGDLAGAEPLLERALKVSKNLHKPDHRHPDVFDALNSLARLYCDQGRMKDSECLFRLTVALITEDEPDEALGESLKPAARAPRRPAGDGPSPRHLSNRQVRDLALLSGADSSLGAAADVGGVAHGAPRAGVAPPPREGPGPSVPPPAAGTSASPKATKLTKMAKLVAKLAAKAEAAQARLKNARVAEEEKAARAQDRLNSHIGFQEAPAAVRGARWERGGGPDHVARQGTATGAGGACHEALAVLA